MNCPYCHRRISNKLIARRLARRGGHSTSDAKVAAARENAKLGGRPKVLRSCPKCGVMMSAREILRHRCP